MIGCEDSVGGQVLLKALYPVLDRFKLNSVFCSEVNVK